MAIEMFEVLGAPRHIAPRVLTYVGPKTTIEGVKYNGFDGTIRKGDRVVLEIRHKDTVLRVAPKTVKTVSLENTKRTANFPYVFAHGSQTYFDVLRNCLDEQGKPIDVQQETTVDVTAVKVTKNFRTLLDALKQENKLNKGKATYSAGVAAYVGNLHGWFYGSVGMRGKGKLSKADIASVTDHLKLTEQIWGKGKPVKVAYRVCDIVGKIGLDETKVVEIGPRPVLSFTDNLKSAIKFQDGFGGQYLVTTEVTAANYVTRHDTCVRMLEELNKPVNMQALELIAKGEAGALYMSNIKEMYRFVKTNRISAQREIILQNPGGKFKVTLIKVFANAMPKSERL